MHHGPAAATALLRLLLNGFIFTTPGKGSSPEAWCPWSATCAMRPDHVHPLLRGCWMAELCKCKGYAFLSSAPRDLMLRWLARGTALESNLAIMLGDLCGIIAQAYHDRLHQQRLGSRT
eukprot:1346576-Prorocentrum_lima.AAC.1